MLKMVNDQQWQAFRAKMGNNAGIQQQAVTTTDAEQKSLNNLRQLALAMSMYVQNHDEQFPAMDNPDMAAVLQLNKQILVRPGTDELYRFNPDLNKINIAKIADPANTVLAFEATPWPDGTHCVLFGDGHVQQLTEQQWQGSPAVIRLVRKVKESYLKANLQDLRNALEQFNADCGVYPVSLMDLVAKKSPTTGITENGETEAIVAGTYRGPYLNPQGGINNTGIPANPFVDMHAAQPDPNKPVTHWKYHNGLVHIADNTPDGETLEGIPYSKL